MWQFRKYAIHLLAMLRTLKQRQNGLFKSKLTYNDLISTSSFNSTQRRALKLPLQNK